jgi:hypothetical protein
MKKKHCRGEVIMYPPKALQRRVMGHGPWPIGGWCVHLWIDSQLTTDLITPDK